MNSRAELLSLTCFYNALLKEWDLHSVQNEEVHLPLKNGWILVLPLNYVSDLGRHQYTGEIRLEKDNEKNILTFEESVDLVADFLSDHFSSSPVSVQKFKERVLSSLHNMEKSFSFKQRRLQNDSLDFIESEQNLLVGHNFHPTPKSRDEFGDQDLERYTPEFRGAFKLEWFLVHPSLVHREQAESFQEASWSQKLFFEEVEKTEIILSYLEKGFVPYPFHPWQRQQLFKKALFQEWESQKLLVFVGLSQNSWRPTSSVRSVHCKTASYMLKFSMSVKLTNSIRHLLPREVKRGLQLGDVLRTSRAQKLLSNLPEFSVIGEPAFLGLKDEKGNILEESLVVCRDNPFQNKKGENHVLLATLAQDSLNSGPNALLQMIFDIQDDLNLRGRLKKWFASFLNVSVRPLVLLQAQEGIILCAHQQNIILKIEKGYPVKSYYRDCQGTGYSDLGYQNYSSLVSSLDLSNGNVVSEKMGNYLFGYYLILNSTFNVISALSQRGQISESELLQMLRDFFIEIKNEGVKDARTINYILNSDKLMHKGNFLCAFQNLNENTTADPLVIYKPIVNPLKGSSHV